jgi:hypothetical protein
MCKAFTFVAAKVAAKLATMQKKVQLKGTMKWLQYMPTFMPPEDKNLHQEKLTLVPMDATSHKNNLKLISFFGMRHI